MLLVTFWLSSPLEGYISLYLILNKYVMLIVLHLNIKHLPLAHGGNYDYIGGGDGFVYLLICY